MEVSLPEGAHRVQGFLASKNSKAKVQMLPESTATAKDAASALGVELHNIGKSIVFGSPVGVIIAIVCGDTRVDTDSISKALQIAEIRSLEAHEVKHMTEYVIGGVSPFALPVESTIIIDSGLYDLPQFFVAAGHPKAVVKTNGREIVALTNASVLSISSPV